MNKVIRFEGKYQIEGHGVRTFKTLHFLSYTTKKGITHLVPENFITDGASIPKILWSIVGSPFTGLYRKPSLIHDELYFTQQVERKYADKVFLEAMAYVGVSFWKRRMMYTGVRIGGWYSWNKHKKKRRIAMKILLISLSIIFVIGCAPIKAYHDGNKITGEGYGFKSAEWHPDGTPKSISRYAPVPIPDVEFDN